MNKQVSLGVVIVVSLVVAMIVSVVSSAINANITSNTIKVATSTVGTEIYSKNEIDQKLSSIVANIRTINSTIRIINSTNYNLSIKINQSVGSILNGSASYTGYIGNFTNATIGSGNAYLCVNGSGRIYRRVGGCP